METEFTACNYHTKELVWRNIQSALALSPIQMVYGNRRMEGEGSSALSCLVFESCLFHSFTSRSWRESKWHHDKMIIFFHSCRHLETKSDVYGIWETLIKCSFPSKGRSMGVMLDMHVVLWEGARGSGRWGRKAFFSSGAQVGTPLTVRGPREKLCLHRTCSQTNLVRKGWSPKPAGGSESSLCPGRNPGVTGGYLS